MRRWSCLLWIIICVGLAGSGCPQQQPGGVAVPTAPIPTTSQPAPVNGPSYATSLLDPLQESSAGAKAVAVGDINGDGLIDVASISDESQTVQIHLRNTTTGLFDTTTIAGGAPLSFSTHIELADLNSDGKLDIAVLVKDTGFATGEGDESSGTIVMLFQGADASTPSHWTQIPDAGASPPTNLQFAGDDQGPTDMLVGEMDGRNGPDIVVLSNDAELRQVFLLANPGAANATDATAWSSTVIEIDITDFGDAALADLDQDGDLDIVMSVPDAKSFNLRWLQNPLAQGGLDVPTNIPMFVSDQADPLLPFAAGTTVTATGKIDDNDSIDIATISGQSQPVQIHLWNSTTSKFDTVSIASGPPLSQLIDIELTDLNRDGKMDIVILAEDTGLSATGNEGALILLFQGSDPRDPTKWVQIPTPGESPTTNMAFAGIQVTDLAVGNTDGVNGDDIIVVSEGAVRLFPNPGDAQSTDKTAWLASVIETEVVGDAKVDLADLDEDGDQDIAMCDPNATGFNIRWLQNPLLGAGSTDTPPPAFISDLIRPDLIDPVFESTAGAKAVWIGDIDGDGANDVASVSDENQTVQIHLWNNATASFDATISIAGGTPLARMNDIEMADFNNDGKLDIAVLVNDTGTTPPPGIRMLSALVLLLQGTNPRNPADWTQVDYTGEPPAVALQNRDMLFMSNAVGATDLALGDVTGDGLPDVLLVSNEDPPPPHAFTYLLSNPGIANVADPTQWNRVAIDNNGPDYSEIKVADIDNDNDLDVVVSAPTTATFNLRWIENNGNGTVWTRRLISQQQGGGESIALGDIDDDGDLDMAVYGVGVQLTQWFRNPGSVFLATGVQVPWDVFNIGEMENTTASIQQVQLVDLDGDAKLDCFVTADGVAVGFRREDNVEDTWESFGITDLDAEIGRVGFADFDANGRIDFLAPLDSDGLTGDRIAFYTTVTNNRWSRRVIARQEDGADFIALGDIDGNGIDVLVASNTMGLIQSFKNPGKATLAQTTEIPWSVTNIGDTLSIDGGAITQIQVVDLDSDGALDCFLTSGVSNGSSTITDSAAWFRNPGSTSSQWEPLLIDTPDPAAEIGGVSFADLGQADGRIDLVAPLDRTGLTQDELVVYLSQAQSGSRWQRRLVAQQNSGSRFVAVGDIDGDGDVDVASTRGDLVFIQWFRNPGAVSLASDAPQVPWNVFNVGQTGDLSDGEISQIQLVDLDGDGQLDCFTSAGSVGLGFQPQADIEDWWTPFSLFTTDPVADIGWVGFADFDADGKLDFVAPLDRVDPTSSNSKTQDQFIVFIQQ